MRRSFSRRFRKITATGATTLKNILHTPQVSAGSSNIESDSQISGPTTILLNDDEETLNSQSITSQNEPSDLWDRAEKALRESSNSQTRKIMETYLSILEAELGSSIVGISSSDRRKQLSRFTVRRIQFLDEKKWTVRIRENHVSVESIFTGIANNILAVKDIVSTAASADPHVALACAGVTVILSVGSISSLLSGPNPFPIICDADESLSFTLVAC